MMNYYLIHLILQENHLHYNFLSMPKSIQQFGDDLI